ncbi:MAG: hypothetical protein OXI26_03915 [bacterium]|nr:hypothetical protein [bacterium]
MAEVPATIVSVGYQGRSVDELIDVLCQGEVEVLVDVRLNPISRSCILDLVGQQHAVNVLDL